jgi:hypothetical protein
VRQHGNRAKFYSFYAKVLVKINNSKSFFLSLNIKLNTEDLWESKGSAPHIHTVDTSWSVVISVSTVREQTPVVLPCGQKARRAHVCLKAVAKTIFCAIGA